MAGHADVEVRPAAASERGALENLFQLYVHDFSEHWAGTPRGELDDAGFFERYDLEPYWRDEGCLPFVIRHAGHLAGVVLLDRTSHLGRVVDHNVAELFVVRKHRRAGVAHAAMSHVFDRFPGTWETAVTRRNTSALAFWRRAIGTHARISGIEEHDVQPPVWNGAVFAFRVV